MFSIVIPVYNEGGNIIKTLDSLNSALKNDYRNYRVYIVFDFDEDTTIEYVKKYSSKIKVKLLKNKYGRGALNAIKTGLYFKDNSVAKIVTMADSSDDAKTIPKMTECFNSGADLVCASRYMKGGAQIGGEKFKSSLSKYAGIILNKIGQIPTSDVTNSFKLYSNKCLEKIKIESDGGFEIGIEFVVKAHKMGLKVDEVPTIWKNNSDSESNFKLLKWLPKYLKWFFYGLFHKAVKS